MYLLIIFLPLISFLIISIFGRYLGSHSSNKIAISCSGMSVVFSFFIFYEIGLEGNIYYIYVSTWFNLSNDIVRWAFFFDPLAATMLFVVTIVSFSVQLYSIDYMKQDPHRAKFMSYLSLFTFFMILLITSSNIPILFIGWEGVGLCSYLLINFWYTRLQANRAALKAIFVNKIGDFSLLLSCSAIYFYFKTLDFSVIFASLPIFYNKDFKNKIYINTNNRIFIFEHLNFYFFEVTPIDFISFTLFIAAVGKSAQLGLHGWLPDAMEGPTPVSALIHAATMVTAGIFLLVRFSPIIDLSQNILYLISIFGSLTLFFGATVGTFQYDIKKIIAYSTCSQLGYMMLAVGLSNYPLAIFHLVNHAFFKALLFLSAGSVIHALTDEQDMRKMGCLLNLLPFTYSCFVIGSFSLT
jgi:proton-translocating NADH-quinone oxidoreductase chain L